MHASQFARPFLVVVSAGAFGLASLAGCGDGGDDAPDAAIDAPAIDAPPPDAAIDAAPVADLSCLGDPDPTTANDPITITGNAFNVGLGGATPVLGATLDVLLASDPTGVAVATGTSDANGEAALSVTTGGVPVDVFVRATADTFVTTETFFPSITDADTPAPAVLFDGDTLNLLASVSGQSLDLVNNGFATVLLLDCSSMPIYNGVITAPSGTVVYAGSNGTPDTSLTATSVAGTAFVFNVTPGEDIVFSAEVDSMALRDNTVRAVAGTVTTLGISP